MAKTDDIQNALKILDKSTNGQATEWYENRSRTNYRHIVDPDSGKWVSQFEGVSGTVYYIRSPLQGIGPKRYTELMKRLPSVGFDDTFNALQNHVQEALNAANTIGSTKPRLSDLFSALANMGEGIRRNDRQWQASFIVATLFIVRKDEDLTTWDIEDAKEKVDDWNKSNIHEQDFFFLVMYWRLLSARWYELLPGKIKELVQDWNPVS